jgi:RING finger protein 113A
MSTPTATFSFIKKGKSRPNALRKRPVSDDESTATTSEVIIAAKKTSLNHLVQGTGFTQKRRKAEAELSAAIESDSDEGESFEVRHSATTERPRRRSSSPPPEVSGEAIKFNKTSAAAKEGRPEAVVDDGMYHGKAGAAHKLPKGFGPIKGGPANVRTITLVDYQPDVCKDYKGVSSSTPS